MLAGVICSDDGERYDFTTCLMCSREGGPRQCHAPIQLLNAMQRNQEDRKDAGISATMLLDCPRKTILMREHDYYEKPEAFWNRYRGTLSHALMEDYGENVDGVIQEVRFRKSIDVDGVEVEITGKADWIDVQRKLIIDYKSAKSLNAKPLNQGIAKEGHDAQLNTYRWLVWGGTRMDTNEQAFIEIEKVGLLYFDMSQYKKIGVRLWSLEETEEFIRERLRPLVHYEQTKELPPILVGDKGGRSFKCNWCPLREACDLREEQAA